MVTPTEQRRIRLRNDYNTMVNIRRPWLQWKAIGGTEPHIEKYELTLQVRTIVGRGPDYREHHVLQLEVNPDHPRVAPVIHMITRPTPFHPNWFSSGRWCHGYWYVYESLGAFVVRMIQTLQYNEDITNPKSPANLDAKNWYLANLNRGWFPCDRTSLPDASSSSSIVTAKKKFQIR